ncbi:MAG: flavodoxin family protein [Armatimonadota bacterium]
MRVLVVYYSCSGMTKRACEAIAASLAAAGHEAVTEELIDRTERGGMLGFVRGGRDAMRRRSTEIEPVQADPTAFDLVVIGTPVWAATCTPAVRVFCEQFAGKLPRVAFVATMGGRGEAGAYAAMRECCGAAPVATLTLIDKAIKSGDAKQLGAKVDCFVRELLKGK